MSQIKKNSLVLFQGDSITDCGRDRENIDNLGVGYPLMVAGMSAALRPDLNLKFINKGISGNRTSDLLNRWDEDCLDLKPDVLSILIGINDVWRKYDSNDETTHAQFEANYDSLLSQVRQKLGDILIIMIEPFLLPEPQEKQHFRDDLDPKIQIVRKLARKYNAKYISLDGTFNDYCSDLSSDSLSADGVHPTPFGHGVITKKWLNAVGIL